MEYMEGMDGKEDLPRLSVVSKSLIGHVSDPPVPLYVNKSATPPPFATPRTVYANVNIQTPRSIFVKTRMQDSLRKCPSVYPKDEIAL